MRYVAPARESVDPAVHARQPLADWHAYADCLRRPTWPSVVELNALLPPGAGHRFVAQTRDLLDDGLHYESRIHAQGAIATREANWHDLFNALIWIRYPAVKRVLNARQVAEIAHMGPQMRSRAQYALTHFDEAGVIVALDDLSLMSLWDAHDWHGLFWRHRDAWRDGRARLCVFGHALLEHALTPDKLLVGKAIAVHANGLPPDVIIDQCAGAIQRGDILNDPLDLRPLPLSGLPGWREDSEIEVFHRTVACYQPRRADRIYPPPLIA